MGITEPEELRLLRERAYGPAADIHDDTAALERLRELEDGARPGVAAPAPIEEPEGRTRSAATVERPPASSEGTVDQPDASSASVGEASVPPVRSAPRRRFLRGVAAYARTRRGARALLWAGTLVVALAVAVAAVTVVQRVQTAPLSAEAVQVARLGTDDGFEAPEVFGSRGPDAPAFQSYREFAGLRAQVSQTGGSFFGPTHDACMYVMQSVDLAEATDGTFPGQLWFGCAAGGFPATAQFVITADYAADVQEEFPIGTAVQFVYDRANDEVVVFRIPPETVSAAP